MQIDPERIDTAEQLMEQLGELYRQGGWSIHRMAEASRLSTATVQAIVNGTTRLPQTATLKAFMAACGHEPGPWVAARGRAARAAKDSRARQRVVNVPRVESTFVGRTAELRRLTRALIPAPGPGAAHAGAGVVVHAVHGLGGVGKSTLAAQWARSHLGELEVAWWVTADTATGVEAGLAGLAVAVRPELAGQPLEALAAHAVGWLAANRGWLLVLDNVTAPRDVAPLLDRDLPGRVVVTSRLAEGWGRLGATVIRLDVLTEQQAIDLLTAIATGDRADADLTGAAELVAELGWLPLAIEQAGAFLHQTRLTPARYLELLRDNPAVMYDQAARGADGERTIARVWRITLDALADTPLAGQLLRIMAWWAPEAIPRTLFDPLGDPAEIIVALGDLAAYNMIALDTATITVHRLVQAVARTPDPDDPHRQPLDIRTALDHATPLLYHALPDDPEQPAQWPALRALLPHITALIDQASENTDTLVTAYLLNEIGVFLNDQGAYAHAILYHQRALNTRARHRGRSHPDTLVSQNNLACAYEAVGDLDQAIPLHEQTLTERERVLKAGHPHILASRNNLAGAYESANQLGRAIRLYKRTFTECRQTLGPDHPHSLRCGNNLAYAIASARQLDQAIRLFEHTLARQQQVLGFDHPDTLATCNNLADAYQEAGKHDQAIDLFQQTLARQEQELGTDHLHSLTTRYNLACAHRAAGEMQRAIPMYEATLANCERVLDADHPLTEAVRRTLKASRS